MDRPYNAPYLLNRFMTNMPNLKSQFGNIDIYLFDQLLKGRLRPPMRVLDAGCGKGRNLVYLFQTGYEVFGVDADPKSVKYVQAIAKRLAPAAPATNFDVAEIASLPFETNRFDAVISSAVLHFAENTAHFHQMVDEMWRVLTPGGMLFARVASTIGIADRVMPLENGWYALPDGTNRFLVDEAVLLNKTKTLGGELLDPLKTTNVQNLRAMTTWVVRK